ncbi:unnamed protein product, partial [marine sediment metagenome]
GDVVIDTSIKSQEEQDKLDLKEQQQSSKRNRKRRRKRQSLEEKAASAAEKRLLQQAKDEDWLANDQKRERQEEIADRRHRFSRRKRVRQVRARTEADLEKDRIDRERTTSRRMMGIAGIATAATMPISGFTPLTIGFASMSGVGFGAGAAVAVMGRAAFDASKALNKWQDELIESAKSIGAVTDRFKELDARQQARGIIQGAIASNQATERMEAWSKSLEDGTNVMRDFNLTWGAIRNSFSTSTANFLNTLTKGVGSKTLHRIAGQVLGG